MEDATTIAQEKLQNLLQQEKILSLASAELQSIVDYTERCASLSTDNELVSMDTEIRKTIQQKIQEHSKSERSLEPVEEADMAVDVTCAEALQQLCLTRANITPAVDLAKCTVDLIAPADVGKLYVGTLTTRLSNGKQNKQKCKVTCHLKSLYNGVITDCAIVKDGPGRYSVQYTPIVQGCHELNVLINGQQAAGSPFPVHVSIHPTQLGKPVKIWTRIKRPSGITANSEGEILVLSAANSPTLVKLTTEGKNVVIVNNSGLTTPRCVACDDEDNVYCLDEKSDKILACTSDGGKVRLRSLALERKSPGRCALAIFNNKLHIAERYHPGVIKIYDKELTLLYIIKHSNMAVRGMAADVHQNLYMSDRNSSCIQVFSKERVFLRSFGHDQEELKCPCGLCVHGQYVYLTDATSHCVFVFTSDGQYVTSFGQKGQKEGDFNLPFRICIDNNNFVYVADLFNNRIQCF